MAEQHKTPENPRYTSAPNPPRLLPDVAQPRYHSLQPGSTPRAFKVSGTQQFITPNPAEVDRNQRYKLLATEAKGHFVGPVHPKWFIQHYVKIQEALHGKTHECPDLPGFKVQWNSLKEDMPEHKMYEPIIKGARIFLKPEGKSGFIDTHSIKDSARDDLSPDILNYSRWYTAPTSKVDLSKVEYFIEAKTGKSFDPFVDKRDKASHYDEDYPFEATADLRMITRGQILTYCAAIARSQFRTHVFGVIILGRHARLFRWDPSGMVVTSLFDYTKPKENYLAQFIWYYDNASLRTRGHDTSVKRISREKVYDLVGEEVAQQVKAKNDLHRRFCIMNISDRKNAEIQHPHLISYPPRYDRMSPFGRMTRTLQAFDLETKEFVFVKDYWRVLASGMAKESDIYEQLEKHNVPNIAPFGNGNDVLCEVWSRKTKDRVLKPVYTRHDGPPKQIKKHGVLEKWKLFRMSLRVIGDGLDTFTSTKQLVKAIADAMQAHDAAYFDARILHRDISVGNIIIHNDQGLLIDWDLCFPLDGVVKGPRRPQRTGTWQFMSAAILQDPKKVQDVSDDRESAFHVLTWTALCYAKHNQTKPDDLRRYLKAYDYSYSAGKHMEGGDLKMNVLTQSKLSDEVVFNPPFDALVAELTEYLSARYVKLKPRDLDHLALMTRMLEDAEQSPYTTASALQNARSARDGDHAYQILSSRKLLETRNWLVEIMRKHLESSDWPMDDRVQDKGLHLTCNSKKRARDETTEELPRSKVERKLDFKDVSSSRLPFRSASSGLLPVMELDDED